MAPSPSCHAAKPLPTCPGAATNTRPPGAAHARRSRQVELAVLDAEGERFPFLGREREHRAVGLRRVAHEVELLGVRLVRPAGRVGGNRDLYAVAPGPAVAGPPPDRSVCRHGTRLLVTVRAGGQEATVRSRPAPRGAAPAADHR